MHKNYNHAIIMVRGGSKGIKKKNLKKINGKPLIFWTLKYCLNQKFIKKTWVCSDNDEILNYSKKIGAEIVKRPKKYSSDKSAVEPGLIFCIKEIEKKFKVSNIFFMQATSPVRKKNTLKKAYNLFIKNSYDSLFSGNENHGFFYIWKIKNKSIKPRYNFKKRPRRQKIGAPIIENGSFYIMDAKKFKVHKNRLFGKIGCYKQSLFESFQIDDMNDLNLINLILENKKKLNIDV